ncbi:MAG: hypothetical protein ACHQRK_07105 [Gemmatimonadales bacterium]
MRLTLLLLTGPLAAPLAAQAPVNLPVRQLPVPAATSAESLGSLAAVRQLPDGRLLVNDQARRRVLLMDSTLKVVGTVADSTSGTANAYGVRPGGLLAYRGDSTLFIDPASLSMLVIDEAGKVVRVMAAPRPSDVQFLVGGPFGNPGFDANGRLVYRSFFRPNFGRRTAGAPIVPEFPDSAALVRFDLRTRSLDTVAFFRIPKQSMTITQTENGGMRITTNINPLPLVDDWAVMSDGTIAIVRGREYRVEFIGADGARTLADKIPYDWQRLTDSDKVAFIDSSKAVMERTRAARAAAVANGGNPGAVALGDGAPDLGGGGGRQVVTMSVERGGGGGGGRDGGPPRRGGNRPQGSADSLAGPQINFVAPSELPDYKPVFGLGAVRADMDDRLWVRTIPTKATPGGAIYDVIDRSGKLIDRVQVPANSTIAGFGKGDIVYLGVRDSTGIHLQRVHAH